MKSKSPFTFVNIITFIHSQSYIDLFEHILDYLRHAPCMRQVQSGYERCASEYQQRIKSLNSGAGGNLLKPMINYTF